MSRFFDEQKRPFEFNNGFPVELMYSLNMRREISQELKKRFSADTLLVFDDVAFAVPPEQRPSYCMQMTLSGPLIQLSNYIRI